MTKTITLTEARQNIFNIRSEIVNSNIPYTLTHKEGNVVLISEDDYNNLLEHIRITKDKRTMNAIAKAIERRKQGKNVYKPAEEIISELENRNNKGS